jgi:nucleoside-diphosphate-sugar epimerase
MIAITGYKGDIASSLLELYRKNNILIFDYKCNNLNKVNRVLHLAAKSLPSDDDEIIESNILYTKKIIKELENNNVKEVIFFSAMSIYGKRNSHNIDEDTICFSPDIYGLSKLIGEELFKNSNLNVLVLRLPAILGNKNKTNIISRWYQQLLSGENINYYNGNKIFNNFISVDSIFNFLRDFQFKDKFDVVNLASQKDMTIEEILKIMATVVNSKSKLINAGENSYFSISTKKAETKYQFIPQSSKETLLAWLDKRISNEL